MGVNWKSLSAKDRLLAALVAAHPDKKLLDYRRIATYYGQGTTYDSIEGQFRIIRKEAAKLRDAVDSGEQVQAPPRGGGATPKPRSKESATATAAATPKPSSASRSLTSKKKSSTNPSTRGVISGRITKSTSPPQMRKPAAGVENKPVIEIKEDEFFSSETGAPLDVDGDDERLDLVDFDSLDDFGDVDWSVPFME